MEVVGMKTAAEQARMITAAWHDLQKRQEQQGRTPTAIHEVRSITFDNAADNRGVKKGLRVKLDEYQEESAVAKGVEFEPLVEKGCGDHMMVICVKEWERVVVREAREWGLEKMNPPSDTWTYLN
jgi:hypothetical protein